MNYYERHLGDYARDAGHLSMLEHGAYCLLLDRYYITEQGIPSDQAHRLCRAKSKEERSAVDAVLAEFFTLAEGAWINGRAAREVIKAQTKIKAARENGKSGGRPKQTPQEPTGLVPGSESVTQEKALQTPDTRHQEKQQTKTARKRAPAVPVPCPDGVDEAVWRDWLALRKAKHAPVTPTVLDGAAGEAAKAGMSLEAFLRIWCRRGTQGLEADWLKSTERGQGASQPAEPAWRTEQRERTAAFAGPAAAKPRTTATVIEMEHAYGTTRRLD